MELTFRIHYYTVPDQVLYVSFNGQEEKALKWSDNHYWVGTIPLVDSKEYSWTYDVRSYKTKEVIRKELIKKEEYRKKKFEKSMFIQDLWDYPMSSKCIEKKTKMIYHVFSFTNKKGGDSAFLIFQREDENQGIWKNVFKVLIDAGYKFDITDGDKKFLKHFKLAEVNENKKRMEPVDAVIITHWDEDHYGGFENLEIRTKKVLCSSIVNNIGLDIFKKIGEEIKHDGKDTPEYIYCGLKGIFNLKNNEDKIDNEFSLFKQDDMEFRILGVDYNIAGGIKVNPPSNEADQKNFASMVCLISCGEKHILTSGDLGNELDFHARKYIKDTLKIEEVQVVKANHHGSVNGVESAQFVGDYSLNPQVIISTYFSSANANTFNRIAFVQAIQNNKIVIFNNIQRCSYVDGSYLSEGGVTIDMSKEFFSDNLLHFNYDEEITQLCKTQFEDDVVKDIEEKLLIPRIKGDVTFYSRKEENEIIVSQNQTEFKVTYQTEIGLLKEKTNKELTKMDSFDETQGFIVFVVETEETIYGICVEKDMKKNNSYSVKVYDLLGSGNCSQSGMSFQSQNGIYVLKKGEKTIIKIDGNENKQQLIRSFPKTKFPFTQTKKELEGKGYKDGDEITIKILKLRFYK